MGWSGSVTTSGDGAPDGAHGGATMVHIRTSGGYQPHGMTMVVTPLWTPSGELVVSVMGVVVMVTIPSCRIIPIGSRHGVVMITSPPLVMVLMMVVVMVHNHGVSTPSEWSWSFMVPPW
jgi:hypothetical protein